MPCLYGGLYETDSTLEQKNREITTLTEKLNSITSLLCNLCSVLENKEYVFPEELLKWWNEHKKLDKERIELERKKDDEKNRLKYLNSVKKRLLNQLSDDELESLGFFPKNM